MAARDRFELQLRCPKCGAHGKAKASEEDYPFMSNPGFRVDELPADFEIVKPAAHRQETVAIHTPCKVKFYL
ncbi:hypothetical protein ACVIGB_006508 [Bradyrhizobium sp. USDA 4341]